MTPNKKSILITGCSSGIGLCVAQGLAAKGYQVFASARRLEDVKQLAQWGLNSLQLDLDDSMSIQQALEQVLQQTGGTLYALFNNAAYGQPGAVEDLSREAIRANFETNVFGTMELTNRILPVMRQQGFGRIIQNSSILGLIALSFRGSYNATKFALEGFTDTLRLELANTNIYLSLIEPGPITSQFRQNAYAAFKKNINPAASPHQNAYRQMEQKLQKKGPVVPFTLPPEAVLKRVIHALESPKPQIRYYVTFPTYLFGFLKRVLPARWLDAVLYRASKA